MSIKPTHTAYVVIEPKEGSDRKPSGTKSAPSGRTKTARASTW